MKQATFLLPQTTTTTTQKKTIEVTSTSVLPITNGSKKTSSKPIKKVENIYYFE